MLMTHVPDTMKSATVGIQVPERISKLREMLGERFVLHIAGDVHYYRRYETEESPARSLIISGSGGAFAHSVSVPEATRFVNGGQTYKSVSAYPTAADADALLASRALSMVHRGAMTYLGFFYAGMVAVVFPVGAEGLPSSLWSQCLHGNCYTFHLSVAALLLVHAIFVSASESGGPRFMLRLVMLAVVHTAVHLFVCFALRCTLELLVFSLLPGWVWLKFWDGGSFLLPIYRVGMLAAMHVFGGLLGNMVYNIYFYVTFLFLRVHWNEAYCHITDVDHRSFLRMRVTPSGDLDIYVIGLEKSPRHWIAGPEFEPDSPLVPHLVEHLHLPVAGAAKQGGLVAQSSRADDIPKPAQPRRRSPL